MTLEEQLEALARAATAVREIGLEADADAAEAILARARARAGFPGTAYVLALAGGTGVGKSSLLNALAGEPVSTVRAVRPTTDRPIAWLPDAKRAELAALLEWVGAGEVATHADPSLGRVVILDLPDMDSVRLEHRRAVDELLPRLDAIAWVVDPEKYDDERLHAYLRSLSDHAARLRFVVNKADRLTDGERAELVEDLRRRLSASGLPGARIHVTSTATGDGIAALRADLAAQADAKAIVADKLLTDAVAARRELARALGVNVGAGWTALLDHDRRDAAERAAVDGALQVVDPPGLARQVQAAILGRARRSGGSLLGRAVGLLGWLTGQNRRRADPAGYLRDWRRRGSLGRVLNPVHAALVDAAQALPARSRPALLRTMGADEAEATISRALDDVARDTSTEVDVRGSLLWPVVGAVQLVVGAVFLLAVVWYVTLLVAGGQVPVGVAELPILGPVPLPLVLVVGSLAVSAMLGFVLSLHAGWIGRRIGRRLAERVRWAVVEAIETRALAGLDRIEEVRRVVAGTRDE